MKQHNKLLNLIKLNQAATKRFEVVNNGDIPELYVYDVIDSWFGVSAESLVKELNNIDSPEIVLRINSPGGDAFDGRAIASAIKAHKSRIVAKIDGLCASAATTIANACDEVQISGGAMYMIHNAWTVAMGNKSDFLELAEFLEKIDSNIAKDYAKRANLDVEKISEMMDAETWMTAEEAKEHGFVDVVVDDSPVNNGFNLSVYDNAPEIKEQPPEPKPATNEILARMAQIKMIEISR